MSNVLHRGVEAHVRGDLHDARRLYRETIGVAQHNLAIIAEQQGENEAAIELYREALKADPARDESAASLALALLRDGRWAEAWPLHEQRRRLKRLGIPEPGPHGREWRGEDLAGQRLTVIGEQGFGDQLMFARFLEPLRARGVETRLVCGAELTRLLGGSAGYGAEDADAWTLLLSLPYRLGTTLETLPPPVRLPVAWRGGGGIGVMAAGNPKYIKHHSRTPTPQVQAGLLALGQDLAPETTGARDFLDTAEIVAGLDLVITIDTAVAHLAGSMGAPTWIMLPALDSDWRWMSGRTDSPWYPSVRLFRQPAPGDWAGALEAVKAALHGAG